MQKIEELLEMWKTDSVIDKTDPGKEILNIPQLHAKYVNIMTFSQLTLKDIHFKVNRMKKLKWEYYTGKLDVDTLKTRGWDPFPYVLKSDISTYMDSDEDINKLLAQKALSEQIVEVCTSIIKELHSRTFQIRAFMDWEKFIQGA